MPLPSSAAFIHDIRKTHVIPALESWFGSMLELLPGQQVYVAAVVHSGGRELRADLNTEEALTDHMAATDVNDLGLKRELRWLPEHWTVLTRYEEPRPDPIKQLATWLEQSFLGQLELAEVDLEQRWVQILDACVNEALSSPTMRQLFARHQQQPVLMVMDTKRPPRPQVTGHGWVRG